jgi:hypothetical protein
MQRRTSDLLAELDRHHASLRDAVEAVPEGLRERGPEAGGWSVANVLEHLAIVEPRIVAGLTEAFVAAKAAGLPAAPDTPAVAPREADKYMNRQRRIESGAGSKPKEQLDAATAWARLEAAHGKVHALVMEADGLDLSGVTMPHPVFGVLNLYEWMVFVAGHEGRHALQIHDIHRALIARP